MKEEFSWLGVKDVKSIREDGLSGIVAFNTKTASRELFWESYVAFISRLPINLNEQNKITELKILARILYYHTTTDHIIEQIYNEHANEPNFDKQKLAEIASSTVENTKVKTIGANKCLETFSKEEPELMLEFRDNFFREYGK